MAKLQDKFYNRVIEGKAELDANDSIAPQAVASAIAGGNVDNAKPLYFHPITIYLANNYSLTMIIINNDGNAFTKTTLLQYLKTAKGRFLINGSYYQSGEGGFYLSPAYANVNTEGTTVFLIGIDSNGDNHTRAENTISFDTIINNASTFEDEVNKIN